MKNSITWCYKILHIQSWRMAQAEDDHMRLFAFNDKQNRALQGSLPSVGSLESGNKRRDTPLGPIGRALIKYWSPKVGLLGALICDSAVQ